jgi:dTDP-4-dehydrorhamnose 3,5-epimerase
MRLISRPLPGMLVLQAEAHTDARGTFARCFCREELADLGLDAGIAQGNLSFSARAGTLRGLHYQLGPSAETKVVTCLQGALHDVVLDLRPASPSYGQHAAIELTAENRRVVIVPEGCAHGYLTLADATMLLYLVTAAYDPIRERAVRWDDPGFAITWPFRPSLLSPRDAGYPDFDPVQHRAA